MKTHDETFDFIEDAYLPALSRNVSMVDPYMTYGNDIHSKLGIPFYVAGISELLTTKSDMLVTMKFP